MYKILENLGIHGNTPLPSFLPSSAWPGRKMRRENVIQYKKDPPKQNPLRRQQALTMTLGLPKQKNEWGKKKHCHLQSVALNKEESNKKGQGGGGAGWGGRWAIYGLPLPLLWSARSGRRIPTEEGDRQRRPVQLARNTGSKHGWSPPTWLAIHGRLMFGILESTYNLHPPGNGRKSGRGHLFTGGGVRRSIEFAVVYVFFVFYFLPKKGTNPRHHVCSHTVSNKR